MAGEISAPGSGSWNILGSRMMGPRTYSPSSAVVKGREKYSVVRVGETHNPLRLEYLNRASLGRMAIQRTGCPSAVSRRRASSPSMRSRWRVVSSMVRSPATASPRSESSK